MAKYIFEMPYIGSSLSDNNYKLPTRGTKPLVKAWMLTLADRVREASIPKAPRYGVGVQGHFRDARRPDIPNLFKVVFDAVKRGLDVDDKYFIAYDEGYGTSSLTPFITITIEPISTTKGLVR